MTMMTMITMMIPEPHQIAIANQALSIIKERGLVYLSMEERTGKTLTSILIAEELSPPHVSNNNVLVLTKKKALEGWAYTHDNFPHKKNYTITNYHQVKNLPAQQYGVVILDEVHNYLSVYPKPSSMWQAVKPFCKNSPIIYLSATSHAQGYSLLYHQLALSDYSPWRAFT